MTLKNILRKKSTIQAKAALPPAKPAALEPEISPELPEFTFMRTTTTTEEIILPPSFPGDKDRLQKPPNQKPAIDSQRSEKRRLFSRSSSKSSVKTTDTAKSTDSGNQGGASKEVAGPRSIELPSRPWTERKLSDRILRRNDRSRSASRDSASSNLPEGLGEAPDAVPAPEAPDKKQQQADAKSPEKKAAKEAREELWEERATRLALGNPLLDGERSEHGEPRKSDHDETHGATGRRRGRSSLEQGQDDSSLQEAIRLHEAGELAPATVIFGRLADPNGSNNALSQVLLGLALRHGWGIAVDSEAAVRNLSLAAKNSASVEAAALAAGLRQGGAAKGELVLAIFELANCFRHGWGVKTDAIAARSYYETAANLGDADALEEAAWCYMQGYGCGKDKVQAAQYLRLAEQLGRKSVGNSWYAIGLPRRICIDMG